MKRSLCLLALTTLLSVTAVAGEIPSGDFVSPPPGPNRPASTSSQELTTAPVGPTDDATDISDAISTLFASLLGSLVR